MKKLISLIFVSLLISACLEDLEPKNCTLIARSALEITIAEEVFADSTVRLEVMEPGVDEVHSYVWPQDSTLFFYAYDGELGLTYFALGDYEVTLLQADSVVESYDIAVELDPETNDCHAKTENLVID